MPYILPFTTYSCFDFCLISAGEDKSDAQRSSSYKHICDFSCCSDVTNVCADVSSYITASYPRYCWQHILAFGKLCCPHWTTCPSASEAACLKVTLSRKRMTLTQSMCSVWTSQHSEVKRITCRHQWVLLIRIKWLHLKFVHLLGQ